MVVNASEKGSKKNVSVKVDMLAPSVKVKLPLLHPTSVVRQFLSRSPSGAQKNLRIYPKFRSREIQETLYFDPDKIILGSYIKKFLKIIERLQVLIRDDISLARGKNVGLLDVLDVLHLTHQHCIEGLDVRDFVIEDVLSGYPEFQQGGLLTPLVLHFSQEHTQCNDDTCLHGGICIEEVGGFKCKCDQGFKGARCEGK